MEFTEADSFLLLHKFKYQYTVLSVNEYTPFEK